MSLIKIADKFPKYGQYPILYKDNRFYIGWYSKIIDGNYCNHDWCWYPTHYHALQKPIEENETT